VCTPEDAYRCFAATDIDTLVLGRHVLHKADLPERDRVADRGAYLKRFEPD
jgi:carbamoyltransferase